MVNDDLPYDGPSLPEDDRAVRQMVTIGAAVGVGQSLADAVAKANHHEAALATACGLFLAADDAAVLGGRGDTSFFSGETLPPDFLPVSYMPGFPAVRECQPR